MQKLKGALMLAVLAAVTMAFADSAADFRKFMRAEGPKVMKAFKNKDIKYFENTSTSDFTYKEFGKPASSKKDSLAGMQMMFGMMQSIDPSFTMHTVKVSGNTATVTLTSRMKGKMMGPDKKTHKMDATTYEKETWVKQGNTWKLKKIEETKKSKMLMDGKPFDPSKMGG
jgi:ketosteroid isomerase-like protein